MLRQVLLNSTHKTHLTLKSHHTLATLSLRYGSSWKKIAPHSHSNELEGADINEDPDDYLDKTPRMIARAASDVARGILWEHGIGRRLIDQENKDLGQDKFDIIGVSVHLSRFGVNKNGIKVWGPKEFPNLSYYGIPGVEIQNEAANNPFECYSVDDRNPLQLHTLTLGENTDPENSFTFVVHPNYYDTVRLIKKFFYPNKGYDRSIGEKPWKLKYLARGVQRDFDEIDVCELQEINNGPITDIWDLQKKALLNPNPLLKSLNVKGLEVYNGFESGEWSGHLLDDMLMAGQKDYVAIAGNDAFFYRNQEDDNFDASQSSKFVPLGCVYGMIDEDTLKKSPLQAFLKMIRNREFYASSGLKIHTNEQPFDSIIQRNGNQFKLESFTYPVQWRAIQYNEGDDDVTMSNWTEAKNIFEYRCRGDWKYVRFEAREKSYVENKQDLLIPCKVRRQIWLQPFFNE